MIAHDTVRVFINTVFQAKGFSDESERIDGEVFRGQSNNKTCRLLNLLFVPTPSGVREKAMAPHSSTLAWQIPWMEEPGGLQSMGLLRVRHD